MIGRFLSHDPVGFVEGGAGYFNRYAYTANDPVNFTDPTGMYARGEGFTDEEWEEFNAIQQQAAADMTSTASDLMAQASILDKLGDPDAANGLRQEAALLVSGAEVLSGDEFTANAGGLGSGLAASVNMATGDVTINNQHPVWSGGLDVSPEFTIGHESFHSIGLRHAEATVRPGVSDVAYRYGDRFEREAYRSIPMGSVRARRNPDHLMSRVYP